MSARTNQRIDGKRLWDTLMQFAAIGAMPKGGVRRLALSDTDRRGRALFRAECEKLGLAVRVDEIGNMFARRPGRDASRLPVLVGSHLDSQPSGGKFDGALGVLAGLEIMRTLTDLGRRAPLVEAVVALDEALHRQLVNRDRLHRFARAHRGGKGIARLRTALELVEPATESPMETRLRLVLVMAGLPRPAAQVPVHDGGQFIARPDLLYCAQRLALEYDGGTHRNSLVEDNRRQNRLVAAGYRILRFTASDVMRHPDTVVAKVRAELAR